MRRTIPIAIWQLNAPPLIPLSLNDDWNLISCTIVPFIHQSDILGIAIGNHL